MITSVSGKPTLNAPPIINPNAESKFASLRIALPDMIAAPSLTIHHQAAIA
jgi:hypothetical protein